MTQINLNVEINGTKSANNQEYASATITNIFHYIGSLSVKISQKFFGVTFSDSPSKT